MSHSQLGIRVIDLRGVSNAEASSASSRGIIAALHNETLVKL